MDWVGGEELKLERFLVAVTELWKTFTVRLRHFIAVSQQPPRILEERAVESARRAIARLRAPAELLEIIVDRQNFRRFLLRLFDLVEQRIYALRICEFLLSIFDRAPDIGIQQSRDITIVTFPIVLDAARILLCATFVLERARAPRVQKRFAPIKRVEQIRNFSVTQLGQFADRKLPIGASRIAAHKRQFAGRRTFRVPPQVIVDLCRISVFVGTEDANIEIEPRIFEIVRIAAVKRDLFLRREHQPHIVVTFVAVKVKLSALVKRDHIGTQSGFLTRFFFDLRHRVRARLVRVVGRHARLHRALYAIGHVFDRDQHVQFEIGRFHFVLLRFGVETVADIIVLLARNLLERVEPNVMIGNAQSVRRNE